MALADRLRESDDPQAAKILRDLQRFFMQSLASGLSAADQPEEDFASLTSRDSQARDELKNAE